jgi:uncharacterized protein involved in tellurium resistance
MFEIKAKNQSALLTRDFTQLMVNLNWTSAIDFDLFAVYETKAGRIGIVYYADQGDLNRFPFMQLSEDQGEGDQGGDNQETMVIASLEDMQYVWVCAWDYNCVSQGIQGRFDRSDLNMTVMSDKGEFKLPLTDKNHGNTALVLTIDNTNFAASKLINSSEITTLNGLNPNQLVQFLKANLSKMTV